MEIYIVTGNSGAGKSIALKTFEDLGFYCIDNLPKELLVSLIAAKQQSHEQQNVALGIDIRTGLDLQDIVQQIKIWKASGIAIKILFLSAQLATLIKRFQETRRKHPLQHMDLASAIRYEAQVLEPLQRMADATIETDNLNTHELRAIIRNFYLTGHEKRTMTVTLMSFGFKYGVPLVSNYMYDVRCLPNPFFVPELSNLSGTDTQVQDFLFQQKPVQEFWDHFINFVNFTLEKSYQEGHWLVTVAIGCTGGRHRSVAFVETLAKLPKPEYRFIIKHRDINKDKE